MCKTASEYIFLYPVGRLQSNNFEELHQGYLSFASDAMQEIP